MDNTPPPKSEGQANVPLIVDLGKQKGKRVKDLRRGQGPLLRKVRRAVENMNNAGLLADDAEPLLVIVERRRPKWK